MASTSNSVLAGGYTWESTRMAFAVGNPTPEESCKTVCGQKRHIGASTQTNKSRIPTGKTTQNISTEQCTRHREEVLVSLMTFLSNYQNLAGCDQDLL